MSAGPEPDNKVKGMVTFEQWSGNYIKVTVNATGVLSGKHALHIHAFGDVTNSCKSTGYQLPGNFLGNIEAKSDGVISSSFFSTFITLFGYNGIIGRSIVIHEKPIDLNNSLNSDVFSVPIHNEVIPFQAEESYVGAPIACGIISITNNIVGNFPTMSPLMPSAVLVK